METSRLVQSSTAAADRRPEDGFSHISNSWTSFARSPPSMGCCPTDQRNNSAMESEENIWQWRSSTASTARRLVVEQASAAEQSKDISLSATPATAELLKMEPHTYPDRQLSVKYNVETNCFYHQFVGSDSDIKMNWVQKYKLDNTQTKMLKAANERNPDIEYTIVVHQHNMSHSISAPSVKSFQTIKTPTKEKHPQLEIVLRKTFVESIKGKNVDGIWMQIEYDIFILCMTNFTEIINNNDKGEDIYLWQWWRSFGIDRLDELQYTTPFVGNPWNVYSGRVRQFGTHVLSKTSEEPTRFREDGKTLRRKTNPPETSGTLHRFRSKDLKYPWTLTTAVQSVELPQGECDVTVTISKDSFYSDGDSDKLRMYVATSCWNRKPSFLFEVNCAEGKQAAAGLCGLIKDQSKGNESAKRGKKRAASTSGDHVAKKPKTGENNQLETKPATETAEAEEAAVTFQLSLPTTLCSNIRKTLYYHNTIKYNVISHKLGGFAVGVVRVYCLNHWLENTGTKESTKP
eukprot:GHVS01000993.1.p1 GENE.GHVS01000993.1~~GHVS01000993.1.p1  ORF type:complete len:517 (-),score=44.46 GHVS01000993.1:108-1658(-)